LNGAINVSAATLAGIPALSGTARGKFIRRQRASDICASALMLRSPPSNFTILLRRGKARTARIAYMSASPPDDT
jgi:hypothetical protein